MTKSVNPVPDGYGTVTPYLIVEDVDGLLAFTARAFGATTLARFEGPDGRVMHAEAQLGTSRIMMGQANEQWPPLPASLHLYVDDVDSVYRRAVEAGGTSLREPETMFYGDRSGGVRDAWGNQWWLATHVEDVSEEEMAKRMETQGTGS